MTRNERVAFLLIAGIAALGVLFGFLIGHTATPAHTGAPCRMVPGGDFNNPGGFSLGNLRCDE